MTKWYVLIVTVLLGLILCLQLMQKKSYAPAFQAVQNIVQEPVGVALPPDASGYANIPLPIADASVGVLRSASVSDKKTAAKLEEEEKIYKKQVKQAQEKLISELTKSLKIKSKKRGK